jgi:GWxTD domain-containing protein
MVLTRIMSSKLGIATGVAAVLAATALTATQSDKGVMVRMIRFYRAEAQRTRIKAFIEIPYSLLTPAGPQARLAYKVAVQLADSTGLTLLQQTWWGHGRSDLQQAGASAMEILDFAVAPGKYRLNVAVQDSISGESKVVSTQVQGFESAPRISDLWLAPRARLPSTGDTVPMPGEVREGTMLVTAAAQTILTPLRATVYYLVEVYSGAPQQGAMHLTVEDSTGAAVVRTPPAPITVAAGGGILQGQLDLAGLPAGRYTMKFSLDSGPDSVSESADFVMRGLEETLDRDTLERAARVVTDVGYFEQMNPAQLDQAAAPLQYIAEGSELAPYSKELSLEAKRRFLTQFWAKRDPTPATPTNEARLRFYEAIAYANRSFTAGGRRPVPGWKSDRGRIYAKFGAADDHLSRQQEGRAPRYEIWRYTRERSRYYIFADRTGFGDFKLITTNDTKESSLANWQEILGLDAVADVERFLGIRLVAQ